MGDVSLNQPMSNAPPPGSTAAKQGDEVPGLMSAGWTNERHSSYISSMEATFMDQLYGHQNHGSAAKRTDMGGHGFKVIQEGVCKNIRFERNDLHPSRDVGKGSLPVNPWVRRFRPRNAGVNRHGDGMDTSIDDCGSGTETVREKVRAHGREVKTCAGETLVGKSKEVSDQNFSEEDVEATDEPCKRRRLTSSSAVPNDQSS